MKFPKLVLLSVFGLSLVGLARPARADGPGAKVPPVLRFQAKDIDGKPVDLAKYRGKVLLIVNVASECGYTDQYRGLQALHAKYGKDGLAVLAFPSNDFGQQEPGGEAQIKAFATKNYGVQFDLFSKVKIIGKDAVPLYRYLASNQFDRQSPGDVRWNFEKFLIGRDGALVARFAADVEPESREVVEPLENALKRK